MTEVRRYPEGAPFAGVIGRTVDRSIPAWPEPPRPASGAPNVLVVLLDDVGFAQFGCFGADIRTPTFDRLAANGLRYRDFHTTAVCTPSRAALLTGRNHHANATGLIIEQARGFPGYHTVIPKENGFLSEILREQGYATFAIGKWHLTPSGETAVGSSHERWPLGRGFDRFYGFLGAKTHQFVPELVYDNHRVTPPKTPEEGYHLNEDMADRAIEFLADLRAADPDKPFFLYYAPGAGHEPHHVPREWADRYRGRFDQGWDRWREEVFARQLEMGIMPKGARLSARPDSIAAWDSLPEAERRLYARQMEVYAGFIEHTDHHIGRVVAFLEELGELDNTILLVTSDNGADAAAGAHGRSGYRDEERTLEVNLPLVERWGDGDTHPNYSWGWAWAGNTPLRRWKSTVHEGGVANPLVVHWPRRIASRGEVRDQYSHIVDIAPTLLELIGVTPPRELHGVSQSELHGVSFAHTLGDAAAPTRKTVQYYEMFGSRAIWADGWKAVTEQGRGELTEEVLAAQRWELYHIAEDPSESEDLAERHPQKLQELIDLWWVEAGKYNVLPLQASQNKAAGLPWTRFRFVYHAGTAPVPSPMAPRVFDHAHRIVADVVVPPGGAEGVLLAHGGGVFGGYTFYVRDGRLHYASVYTEHQRTRVTSDRELPVGALSLAANVSRVGTQRAAVELLLNGDVIGRGEVARAIPFMSAMQEGLSCGYDACLPVDDYPAPFRFTGSIRRVVVELDPP